MRLLQETISSIDPVAKRVKTNHGVHEADFLVVALGADYDFDATPGMAQATEFYTLEGATKLGEILRTFDKGRILIAVGGAPFKCPPAPSEAALMMHDYLTTRGIREATRLCIPTNEYQRPIDQRLCQFGALAISSIRSRVIGWCRVTTVGISFSMPKMP